MNSFKRLFKYIWPQWPRIVVVIFSALVLSALLSLSFMTIIPLLKVMVNEEGLHPWVDRKVCELKYGMDFYVPNMADLGQNDNNDIAYCLQVTSIKSKSLAHSAGIIKDDRIIAVADQKGIYTALLEKLAKADSNEITIFVKRPKNAAFEDKTFLLKTTQPIYSKESEHSGYFPSIKQWFKNISSGVTQNVSAVVIKYAEKAVNVLPREKGRETRLKAVVFIILLMLVVTVVRCMAKFFQAYLGEKIVQVGINHLRRDAFKHVLDIPVGFFDDKRPSDTVSRILSDTSMMAKGMKILLGKALREPLNAIFFVMAAMLLNWHLTLIFLLGAPMAVGTLAIFGKKMKRAATKSLQVSSQMLSKMQETISNLRVVKVYNRQGYEYSKFEELNLKFLKQLLKISKVDNATNPVMEVFGMMAGSAAIVFGAHLVFESQMDGTEFLVFIGLLGAAAEAVRKTSDIWNVTQEANAAAERVFAVVDCPVEIEKTGAEKLLPLRRGIEFRNLTFSYAGTDSPAIKCINLTVPAGRNIAIVGPNGSGKTTLVNMIPRFYDPDDGQVLIDGKDIRDVTLSSLRDQIGMVTQKVVTFHGTIADNIAYGKPGATRDEIIAAAKKAFAHEFIETAQNGYDTIIGEQGTGLSGGQLQRIVIARAILKDPTILIFDEATSQVDADSEAKIHKAIEEMMRGRTSFIIAHRFSTVISADVIVVMDNGQIVTQGTHDELIKNCSIYQTLYRTQLVK